MHVLIPILLAGFIGAVCSNFLLRESKVPNKFFLATAISLPIGLAVCSLVIFFFFVLNAELGSKFSLAGTILIGVIFLICSLCNFKFKNNLKNSFSFKKLLNIRSIEFWLIVLSGILFLFLLIQYLYYFWGQVSWNVIGGWDARFFWNLKAKFYFREPELWQNMFSSVLNWSHPDYPLMIPGAVAWGWNILGYELFLWPISIDLIFMLSLCFLIIWYLGSFVNWPSAFLAGSLFLNIYMFRLYSTVQYVDIPLCFFITGATLFFLIAIKLHY